MDRRAVLELDRQVAVCLLYGLDLSSLNNIRQFVIGSHSSVVSPPMTRPRSRLSRVRWHVGLKVALVRIDPIRCYGLLRRFQADRAVTDQSVQPALQRILDMCVPHEAVRLRPQIPDAI